MPSTTKDASEEIPLSELAPTPLIEEKPGYFFTKTKLIAAIVLLLVLVIIVIVLAVCLGIARSSIQKERLEETTQFYTTMFTSVAPTTAGTERWWNPRLPTNVVPRQYNLFLNITVDEPRFDGRVDIEVEVKNATDLIILHSMDINISLVEIRDRTQERSTAASVQQHFSFPKYDYYVIQMNEHLQPGRYLLKLVFEAFFSTGMIGMYRGSFKRSSDGKKVNYAATQLEDIHARKAFPCFDEPAMKSTFNVTIAHRPDYVALCNMPVYKTVTINNWKFDHFSKSVVMPTYLLAFVVGDFAVKQAVSKNNITMRYYSRPSYVQTLDYALSVGGKIMTYFEDLFDVKYSLPKEDMVAVPQFRAGAMENWGLILYRENLLLWDPKESTEGSKVSVASVMSHELAHMWFGNIVTLNWWNDIWLNEGFAKFFDLRGRDVAEPEWKDIDSGALWNSMLFDSTSLSNPISEDKNAVRSTVSVSGIIHYDKASCVINMIQGFLGEKTFIDGLRIYLKRHAFANAVTDDLWRALTEATCASGKCMDIKQIMDPWTLQMGYPVVTFKKKNATHYTVSQTHFKTSRNATYRKSDFGYSWVIPLTYVIKDQGSSFTWMNMSSATIKWDGKGWIKANTDHKGFYLTNYDDSNWRALAEQLKTNHTVFSPPDRAGMLLDLSHLVNDIRNPKIEYSTVFMLTEYMRNETDYLPWRMTLQLVTAMMQMLPRTNRAHRYLMKYVVFLGKNQYDRLGFQDSGSSPDKVIRGKFLELFCKAKVESCTNKAKQLFKDWMDKPNEPPVPNLRKFVLYYGVALGGLEEWDFLYNQYNKTKSEAVKDDIMYGLAASREPWIIERYLWYLIDPVRFSTIEQQKGFYYVISSNPYGVQFAWGFLRVNLAKLISKFGEKIVYFNLVPTVTSMFDTQFMLEEYQRFMKQNFNGWSDQEQENRIKTRIAWLAKNEKIIEKALENLLVKNNILHVV